MISTRRRFLGWLAALPLVGRRAIANKSAQSRKAFPFLDRYNPITPGSVVFKPVSYVPSFLHPNGRWVALSNPEGGLELWDWRRGEPVRSISGDSVSDELAPPCGGEGFVSGLFSENGMAWINGRTRSSNDDYDKLLGSSEHGEQSWTDNLISSSLAQVDPYTARLHWIGRSEDRPNDPTQFQRSSPSWSCEDLGPLPVSVAPIIFETKTAISPDGRWLLTFLPPYGGDGWWAIWSLSDGMCRAFRPGTLEPGTSKGERGLVGFNLNGSRAFTPLPWDWAGTASSDIAPANIWGTWGLGPNEVSVDGGNARLVRKGSGILEAHDAKDNRLLRRLVSFPPNTQLVAPGPERHLVLVAPPLGAPCLWNRTAPIRKVEGGSDGLNRPGFSTLSAEHTRALVWSQDGRIVAVGSADGKVSIWEVSTFRIPNGQKEDEENLGGFLRNLTGLDEPVRALAFAPGVIWALSMRGQVMGWDLNRGVMLRTWKAHPIRANTLQVSQDGKVLFTGGLDGIRRWTSEGKLVKHWAKEHHGVSCLHLAGPLLAVAFLDGSIALFNARDCSRKWTAQVDESVVAGIAIHPSGNHLASMGWGEGLKIWNLDGSLRTHIGRPGSSLAWTRDGKRLIVGGSSVTVLDEAFAIPQIRDPEDLSDIPDPAYILDFYWDSECT